MTQTTVDDVAGPAEQPSPSEAELGLRERKKRATRRTLQRIALEMVAERGMDNVTVEEIAAAADVSPRTFFNYFGAKEDALAGADPEAMTEMTQALRSRPAQEPPLEALRAMCMVRAQAAETDHDVWRLRIQVSKANPELFSRLIGASVAIDQQLSEVIAERLGVSLDADPRPVLAVGMANAARRAASRIWAGEGFRRSYAEVLTEAFDALPGLVDET